MRKLILFSLFLSGVSALIFEVVWIRSLSLIFGSSVYATSTMLACFMAGLAVGGYLGGQISDKYKEKIFLFGLLELLIGLFGLFTVFSFNYIPYTYFKLYSISYQDSFLFLLFQFLLCFLVLIIPTTLMGLTFPLVAKITTQDLNTSGKNIGNIYCINNLGAIVGSLIAGFLLIPVLGIKNTTFSASILNLIAGVALLSITTNKKLNFFLIVPAFLIVAEFLLSFEGKKYDFNIYMIRKIPNYQRVLDNETVFDIVYEKDDIQGKVKVLSYKRDNKMKVLQVGGKIEGDITLDIANEKMLVYLPFVINPKSRNFLGIGLGTGTTTYYAKKLITDITWIEINKSVVYAVNKYFYKDLTKDINLVIDDARHFLLYTNKKFDIISSEPSYPTDSVTANLFAYEFFKIINKRLTKDGVFCQWLPYYLVTDYDVTMMIKTFRKVFKYTSVWRVASSNDLLFIGSNSPYSDNAHQTRKKIFMLSDEYPDYLVLSRPINKVNEDLKFEKNIPLNTDDKPFLEFASIHNLIMGTGGLP